MTITEALQHYLKYAPDLKPRTVQRMGHDLNRWKAHVGDLEIGEITTESFAEFRSSFIPGHSPRTVEGNVSTVLTILNHAHRFRLLAFVPHKGRSLRIPPPNIEQPTLDEIQKFYACTHVASWPKRIHVTPAIFWRAWIVVCYFTALRISDILQLSWSMIDEAEGRIAVQAEKTSKRHVLPIHPVLWAHLSMLRGPFDCVFPCRQSLKQLRREMQVISKAAGIRYVTTQMLRRASATEWERARHGAGQLIQGSTLRNSSRFYIDVPEILKDAMDKVRVPEVFVDGVEVAEQIAEKQRLERIRLEPYQFELPKLPDPKEWAFAPGCACFRSRWFSINGSHRRALKCLVESGEAVGVDKLAPAIYEKPPKASPEAVAGRVGSVLSRLRTKLREAFGLEETFDPVPCIAVERLNGGGKWTVFVPYNRNGDESEPGKSNGKE